MKAIVLSSILSGFRSRKDKSMGFSASTLELSTDEKVALMELEGLNVRLLIEPVDYVAEGKVEVKSESSFKTPSQRLRSILFVEYRQKNPSITFDEFYNIEMDRICNERKEQLENRF
jgi:hypothetical protein